MYFNMVTRRIANKNQKFMIFCNYNFDSIQNTQGRGAISQPQAARSRLFVRPPCAPALRSGPAGLRYPPGVRIT
jgi:hypothetical protein